MNICQTKTKTEPLQNKGFQVLHDLFLQHGWHIVVNEPTRLCYTRQGDETTTIALQVVADKIIVSVPLKNSVYQYTSSFTSYFAATEYVEQRFYDYIGLIE